MARMRESIKAGSFAALHEELRLRWSRDQEG